MKIYYHWITCSAQNITEEDLETFSHLVNVPLRFFNRHTAKTGAQYLTYTAPGSTAKDSIHITIPAHALYGTVTLKGSFFNSYESFPVHTLWDWIKSKGGNIVKSDTTFEDDCKCLSQDELRNMCSLDNYQNFMTGSSVCDRKKTKSDQPNSNNREGVPDVHQNSSLVHYGNVSAKYCAKSYTMNNGNIKIELTINDKKYNQALIEAYTPGSKEKYEDLAKQALVKCVNFVKPASKRGKRLVQVDSWLSFLGSPTKAIKWTDYTPAASPEELSFADRLYRQIGQIQNLCSKYDILRDTENIILQLQEVAMRAFDSNQAIKAAFA